MSLQPTHHRELEYIVEQEGIAAVLTALTAICDHRTHTLAEIHQWAHGAKKWAAIHSALVVAARMATEIKD